MIIMDLINPLWGLGKLWESKPSHMNTEEKSAPAKFSSVTAQGACGHAHY